MFANFNLKNDRGMTLVEILASLVILSILIISFLALFGQSAKQNKNSEQVMDATYVAQEYMEKIYAISKSDPANFTSIMDGMKANYGPYQKQVEDGKVIYSFEKNSPDNNYNAVILLYEPESDRTGRLLVKVYDALDETKLKAQMETVLFWGQ